MLASLGCGNPTAVAELREGERVLDLGSGGGIDVLLSAKRVGPTGRVYRPRHDRRDAGPGAAERRARRARPTSSSCKGHIEAIPLPADVGRRRDHQLRDQPRGRQAGGVPRDRAGAAAGWPDGRHRHRRRGPADGRRARGARAATSGCIAGALSFSEFRVGLEAAGLVDVTLTPTHDVADGMVSAIVQARKPSDVRPLIDLTPRHALPLSDATCGCGDGACC